MKVLVIGSGGREDAICWKVSQSSRVSRVYCAPGNPGTLRYAENVAIEATDVERLTTWAVANGIDLTIVGGEAPLSLGVVNNFRAAGLKIFGPLKEAARLESSKAFAKEILNCAQVPTPKGRVFDDYQEALRYVREQDAPVVIKADGLAAGKGVVLPDSLAETEQVLHDFMVGRTLGEAGARVVLEERIRGKEASVMAFVSGSSGSAASSGGIVAKPFVVSQDYKRIHDGDAGPNTGGMGAISPTPVLGDERAQEVVDTMFIPVLKELQKRGISYTGFLYGGLIIDDAGVARILEFNCRLGDPETQVLLPRLESDLVDIIQACIDGHLENQQIVWRKEAACCVVAASRGYPVAGDYGDRITGLDRCADDASSKSRVFQAGTKLLEDGSLVTAGGRVLAVSALGGNVGEALRHAYNGIAKIEFSGMQYRKDIGAL